MTFQFSVCLFVISLFSFSVQAKVVTHSVLEDETAWFLAQLYYGSGKQYPKLLSANKLQRAEEIKEGMEIKIHDPKFTKEDSHFQARYNQIWESRQKALGLAKDRLPAESILTKDKTPHLEFSETQERQQSQTEKKGG